MVEGIPSPDGKWVLTDKGWLCTKSDSSKTPDGIWTYHSGQFSRIQHLEDDFIDGSVEMMATASTSHPQLNTLVGDSVVMGDLQVNLQQGASLNDIKHVIQELLQSMGATTWHTPLHVSDEQRRQLTQTIDGYDQYVSEGGISDPATELLVATASKVAGNFAGAIHRLTALTEHHSDKPEADISIELLAQILIRLQDWEAAEDWIQKAEVRFRRTGNRLRLGNTYMRHARVLAAQGNIHAALKLFDEAILIGEQENSHVLHIRSLVNRGVLLSNSGQSAEAKDCLSKGLQLARASGDVSSVRKINDELSKIYEAEGDIQNASRLLREARSDYLDSEDKFIAAEQEFVEGRLAERRGNLQIAKAKYMKAEDKFGTIHAKGKQGEVCITLGDLYDDAEEYLEAISWYQKALDCLSEEPTQQNDRLHCLIQLGGLFLLQKEYSVSIQHSTKAVTLALDLNDHVNRFAALRNLCHAQAYSGDARSAHQTRLAAVNLASLHPDLNADELPEL